MLHDLQFRFARVLLTVLTVGAVLAGVLNLQQQRRFELPDDGLTWVDTHFGVEARRVALDSPAGRSGLRSGDVLVSINGVTVKRSLLVPQILFGIGTWKKAEYKVQRQGIDLRYTLIIEPVERSPVVFYLYAVGFLHLAIGLFVFFRREGAPQAQHFYVFCLAAFIL